jgi:hypothetical protein
MPHIAEATSVAERPELARERLLACLAKLPGGSDGHATLHLVAGSAPRGLHLEHDVDATFAPAQDPRGLEFRLGIAWKPTGTRLLPEFKGVVRFQYDEDYGHTWLRIEGDYEPPLGAAGSAFDAVAGQRIARTTLRALLDEFRTVVEST